MRKHSFLRGLTAFTLAGLLAFYSGVVQLPNVSAESITDLKSQLAELEKQEEENNKRQRLTEMKNIKEIDQSVIDNFVEKVVLYPNKIKIVWKFRDIEQ